MGRFREFTKEDYCGYAGATHLKNGSKPLIATADNRNIEVVVSGSEENPSFTEVQFNLAYDLDNDVIYGKIYGATCPVDFILNELEAILDLRETQIIDLKDFGFERLV